MTTHTEELTDILAFLESMRNLRNTNGMVQRGFAYDCVEDWLLQHGKQMAPPSQRTPAEMNRLRRLRKHVRPKLKQCFANCQSALLSIDDNLTYCEGYVLSVIPIYHAWLILDGTLWDPTLELLPGHQPTTYFGATFPFTVVESMMCARNTYGPLLDNWEQRWPLLRQPWIDQQSHQHNNITVSTKGTSHVIEPTPHFTHAQNIFTG